MPVATALFSRFLSFSCAKQKSLSSSAVLYSPSFARGTCTAHRSAWPQSRSVVACSSQSVEHPSLLDVSLEPVLTNARASLKKGNGLGSTTAPHPASRPRPCPLRRRIGRHRYATEQARHHVLLTHTHILYAVCLCESTSTILGARAPAVAHKALTMG